MSTTRPPAYDERFATPIDASRRGAHRARPKPVSAGLPVLAGIAVVLVVIGGVYTVLSGNHKSDPGTAITTASPQVSSTAHSSAQASSTARATPSVATATTPAGSAGSTTPGATAPAGTGSSGAVDRGVSLKVLNSVGVPGLAKKVQARLEPDGWSVGSTGNSINRGLATTKVYYGSSSLKATAEAMVQDLGYGTAVLDAAVAPKGLVVVLGQDAE